MTESKSDDARSEQVENKKLSKKEFIEKLKNVFTEINTLTEDIKQLKDDAKDAGYDPALLAKVAKALAEEKVDDILEKAEVFKVLVDEYDNAAE